MVVVGVDAVVADGDVVMVVVGDDGADNISLSRLSSTSSLLPSFRRFKTTLARLGSRGENGDD